MCAAVVAGIVAVGLIVRDGTLLGLVPLENSPQVTADRARQLVSDLGYPTPPADSARWYEVDRDYVQDRVGRVKAPGQYRQVWSEKPGPWRFVYRQSPQPLAILDPIVQVSRADPPNDVPGMITVILDANGRSLYFSAVPQEIQENPAAATIDWSPLLSNAGLKELVSATPKIKPPGSFDSVSAWNGKLWDDNVHVITAAYQGRPTYFEVIDNATSEIHKGASASIRAEKMTWLGSILFLCYPVACVLLARRNMQLGRVDCKGAIRLAALIFAHTFLRRSLMTHYINDAAQLFSAYFYGVGVALFSAVVMAYVSYLALEPYVRRRWPRMMISWSGPGSRVSGACHISGQSCVVFALGMTARKTPWRRGNPRTSPTTG